MEDSTVVLYPAAGRGHLIAMVELGKHLLTQNTSLSITIIVTTPPFEAAASTIEYAATNPSITFHHLPAVSLIKSYSLPVEIPDLLYDYAELSKPKLHEALQTISKTSIIKAFVIDFFNTPAFQVSSNLNIPTYYFFTSGANGLAMFLYFPTIHKNTSKSLKDLDLLLEAPGLPPIPSKDMPVAMLDRTTAVYNRFMETAVYLAKSAGLIVNTFELLEQSAINSMLNGDCTLGQKPPPLYCIGPLVETSKNLNGGNEKEDVGDQHECLSWLDSQPSRSVVFLCFGSLGVFSSKQLKEIAVAIQRSNVRFLWVVRKPPQDDEAWVTLASNEPEPTVESFLPEGFLNRTKDRGLVAKDWAPQVKVLSHDSVGGFVTHCGWNSVLEAVCAGVPMLAWPLYAEQKMNRVFVVEEMKVALWVAESSEDGLVSARELEKRVSELMESEKGREVRERVRMMRDGAVAAMKDGGSSNVASARLVESLKRGTSE